MGEAKRRKLVGDYPTISIDVPWDIKDDIAKSIRHFSLVQMGGSCIPYAQVARRLLAELGFHTTIELGSLLYRAGSDELRDTVSYAAFKNLGCLVLGYGFVGHVWLRMGADIIDFTDLKRNVHEAYIGLTACESELARAEEEVGEVEWLVDPPSYLWQPIKPLRDAWRPSGSPAIGKTWIGGFDPRYGRPPIDEEDEHVPMMFNASIREAHRLQLPERLAEWRSK